MKHKRIGYREKGPFFMPSYPSVKHKDNLRSMYHKHYGYYKFRFVTLYIFYIDNIYLHAYDLGVV